MTDEENTFGVGAFGTQFGAGNTTDAKTMITNIMRMTGVGSTDSDYRTVVLAFANQVYLTVLKGRHWKFLNKELFMETLAPYETGTIQATQGSHEIEEENATALLTFNTNHLGQMLSVGANEEYYRILKIISSKKLEINPGFIGDTTTSTSYKILNDRFTLDSKVQDLKNLTVIGHREIKPVGLQYFRTLKESDPTLEGTPEWFTIIGERDQDGSKTVEIYPSPDKKYGLHMEYTERPLVLEDSESCYLALPPEHMDVMYLGVRAKIYEDQNNVNMARDVGAQAAAAWNRMAGDQELTDSRARLQQGRNYFHRRHRGFRGHSVYYGLKHFGKF